MIKTQLLCALLMTTAAFADNANREKEFARMDADGNGEVSREEFTAYWEKWFASQDKNGDGKLDSQERAHKSAQSAKSDDSGDSGDAAQHAELTAEDHRAMRDQIFQKLDADKNGVLSKEEYHVTGGDQ